MRGSFKKPTGQPKVGRKRLLEPLLSRKVQAEMKTIKTIKDDTPLWARGKETKREVPTFGTGDDEPEHEEFEDDFIQDEGEDIEDDFISDEDEDELDEFHLLENVTTMLQESILPASNVNTWRYVPAEPRPMVNTGDLKTPVFPSANDNTDAYKVESLRVQLESELGDEALAELYRCLQNTSDPKCKKVVQDWEKKNKKVVQDVRNLIYLEDSF